MQKKLHRNCMRDLRKVGQASLPFPLCSAAFFELREARIVAAAIVDEDLAGHLPRPNADAYGPCGYISIWTILLDGVNIRSVGCRI